VRSVPRNRMHRDENDEGDSEPSSGLPRLSWAMTLLPLNVQSVVLKPESYVPVKQAGSSLLSGFGGEIVQRGRYSAGAIGN
jgi:hypothetical protein